MRELEGGGNDSGNRRQGGGGWGTPLKKRSATRIKISKIEFSEPTCVSFMGTYSALISLHALSVQTLNFLCAPTYFNSHPLKEQYAYRADPAQEKSCDNTFAHSGRLFRLNDTARDPRPGLSGRLR